MIEVIKTTKRITLEEAKQEFVNINLVPLFEEYNNNHEKLLAKTQEEYIVYINLNNLKSKKGLGIFHKSNPYTIFNIKLWLKINNKPLELLSEEYKSDKERLKWKCLKPECREEFEMNWNDTSHDHGCSYCSGQKVGLSNCLATKNPELASEWHPNLNGDLTPYDVTCNSNKMMWWKCQGCGNEWPSIIKNRNDGNGCPRCSNSNANNKIIEFCITNNIDYSPEFRIKECKDKISLPFDVKIIYKNIVHLIEADGLQHYKPVRFGGISYKRALQIFKTTQLHDEIKNQYCKNNKINLIRIPYWDFDNIEEILKGMLNNN